MNQKKSLKIPFFKMNGLSNDFIFMDKKYAFDTRNVIKLMCDRKLGIGCDQLVVYSENLEKKVVSIDIINNDGSHAEVCGNAFRCTGDYFCEKNSWDNMSIFANKKEYPIEHNNGISFVNMGQPIFKEITLDNIGNYKKPFYVNVGNPHVVLFSNDNIKKEDVIELGQQIENHKMFPKKTNVNFVKVINEQNIEIQTWERGIGYSLSCGSGAVASFIASNTLGLVALNANIQTCGGLLTASLENKNIIISGKTSFVFEGIYNIPLLK
jgi:diaminopimelate epimerase